VPWPLRILFFLRRRDFLRRREGKNSHAHPEECGEDLTVLGDRLALPFELLLLELPRLVDGILALCRLCRFSGLFLLVEIYWLLYGCADRLELLLRSRLLVLLAGLVLPLLLCPIAFELACYLA